MNAEEKQALIVQIRQYLQAVDNNSTMFTPVSVFHDMARVALAALTAPPVKAPEFAVHANQPCWPSITVGMRDGEWKQALRAQGFQVEDE